MILNLTVIQVMQLMNAYHPWTQEDHLCVVILKKSLKYFIIGLDIMTM